MEQSAAVEKFVDRIKSKYTERRLNRERQWPPCKSEKLVRLELVEGEQRQGYSAGQTRGGDNETSANKWGQGYSASQTRGKCDKAVKRSPLAYSDILKAKDGRRRVRKVLVEGDAGIGKTTLCTAFSEDWANGKLFQEFKIILLLHLRQNQIASAGSLLGLLKLLHSSSEICALVAKYIEDQNEGKVLIVADGWDELSTENRSEGSFLYELLFGERYSISVIVTSRPSASVPFHKLRCIDRFVEVHGFSNENIKEFIQCEFARDRAKGSGLLAQLEGNPLIESVCSVPLNCAIVCHLWDCFDGALPTTMSELYTKIILNVILRNIRKKSEYESIPSLPHFDSLPDSLEHPWSLLCELAFQTLSKHKIVFSYEDLGKRFPNLDLDSGIFCFGLLQSAESILVDGHGVSFHFLHLTFQEYLAALYLVRQPTDKQLQVCWLHAGSKRFEMVWRFFFGLSFSVYNKPVSADVSELLIVAYDSTTKHDVNLLGHFALEANQRALNDLIAARIVIRSEQIHGEVLFETNVAFDSAAIIHVITNLRDCYGISIILRDCGLRDKQIIALADALADEDRKLRVKRIDLSDNRLTDESLAVLFERASPAFSQSLRYVLLSNNMIGSKTINSLTSVKKFSYRWLDISDSPLGVDGRKALRDALCANKLAYLNRLSLAGSLTSDADTNAELILSLGSGHPTMCRLKDLDLSRNNLGAPGGKALGKILSDLHLNTLYLIETMLGDEGVAALIQNLKDTVSLELESLYLDNNGIQAAGVSCLAKSVCTGRLQSIYKGFSLANNPLGLEGVPHVVKILTSGHCRTRSINLSGCQLTTAGGSATNHDLNAVGVQKLICSQQPLDFIVTVDCLCEVVIDNNNFSGEGIHILATFMYTFQKIVGKLSCCSCGITCIDLSRLFFLLSELNIRLSHLFSWDFRDNDVDNNNELQELLRHSEFGTDRLPMELGPRELGPQEVAPFFSPLGDDESWDHELASAAHMEDNDIANEPCSTGPTVTMDTGNRPKLATIDAEGVEQLQLDSEETTTTGAVSESGSEQEVVPQSTCSATAIKQVQRLHGGVSKHLGQIADAMYEWEGPIAEQLELTIADVANIKTEHPNNLRLQTCEHSAYLNEIEPCSTEQNVTMDIGNSNGPKLATMEAEGVKQLQPTALDSEETTTTGAVSESGSEQEVVPLPTCSATARQVQMLDQVVGSEQDGVSKHHTGADVATVKTEHPNNLRLEKCECSTEIKPCSTGATVTMDTGNGPKLATMEAKGVEQLQPTALDSEETTTTEAVSESGSKQEVVPLPTCSATAPQLQVQRLDLVVDSEHGRVSKHLGQIADAMYEWEGPIAEQLELTNVDIAAINKKHPGELKLQTRDALELWKQRRGSDATYNNLIKVFERAGYKNLADVVRSIAGDVEASSATSQTTPPQWHTHIYKKVENSCHIC